MAEFRNRKKVSNFLHSTPVLIALFGLAILFAINIFDIAKKGIETERNKDIAYAKVEDLKENQLRLEADIERLDTPEGAEDAVRDKFRVVKEGEGLVVILDDKNAETPAPPERSGVWHFLQNLFR